MAVDENLQDNGFFSWASPGAMDFNTLFPQETEPSNGGTGPDEQSVPALSNSPTDEPTDPAYLITSKLTELLLDMGRLWAKMPVKSTLHLAQRNSHEEHVKNLTDKIASKAALESIFALSQRLIDLYHDAISTALPLDTGPPPTCDIPDCTHSLELPPALDDIEKQISGQEEAPRTDMPLANVLLSCHARLLDLVDCFFLLVTSCLRVTVASPDRREPEFNGPEMRVGSFVPPKTAAVSMQIALLKHLMVGLVGQAGLVRHGCVVSSKGSAAAAWKRKSSLCSINFSRRGTPHIWGMLAPLRTS
ncbi:hypothetical protein INS49_002828 [Diaporthe citri]|uniref:uncharacterized protein n=1 Tax=Diaporthe citri TaxID=83186 RepID=UPI001C8247C2|nr:uncharacterized protein INS49_002828 [Diaporthe citri]KAG6368615.1 hypothetical protein INS49_002828 [Diaporthe citri]